MKENRKRNVTLTIRVTKEERNAIIAKALEAGLNVTDYILAANASAVISPPPDLKPVLGALKRIGTNINQIAAKVNSGVAYVPGLEDVAAQQAALIAQLRALTEERSWRP